MKNFLIGQLIALPLSVLALVLLDPSGSDLGQIAGQFLFMVAGAVIWESVQQ